jgi:hypothetical protein
VVEPVGTTPTVATDIINPRTKVNMMTPVEKRSEFHVSLCQTRAESAAQLAVECE